MSQSSLNLPTEPTGPVVCLGQTFASEDVRREHYLKLLTQKLKDPEFRKIEGFPIGKDEDIPSLRTPDPSRDFMGVWKMDEPILLIGGEPGQN